MTYRADSRSLRVQLAEDARLAAVPPVLSAAERAELKRHKAEALAGRYCSDPGCQCGQDVYWPARAATKPAKRAAGKAA